MILSVSKDDFEWSLDFGPDSVTLTVKDLVQETVHGMKDKVVSSVSATYYRVCVLV